MALNSIPTPYRGLAYSAGFGAGASGTPVTGIVKAIQIDPVSQLRAVPSIRSTYSGSDVQSFYPRSFEFLCALYGGQQDAGVARSYQIQLTGRTEAGVLVARYCNYEAPPVGTPRRSTS